MSELTTTCQHATYQGPCGQPVVEGTERCQKHGGKAKLKQYQREQYELEVETRKRMERFARGKEQFLLDEEVQIAQMKLELITNEMDKAEHGAKAGYAAAQDAALQTVAKLKLQNTMQHEKMRHLFTRAQVVEVLQYSVKLFGETTKHIEGHEELAKQFTEKLADAVDRKE